MDTQSTADIFNKVALATVAIIGAVVSPILQWRIAKRQTLLQEQIAEQQATLQDALATQQVDLQRRIAERQVADNISAKRQVWIDELGADVAEYLANIARIEELRRPPPNLSAEQSAQNFEDFAEANKRGTELGIRIKLRLNPREDEHNQFVNLLKTLAEVCKDPPANESDAQKQEALELFSVARDNVVAHLQLILKHEWERIIRCSTPPPQAWQQPGRSARSLWKLVAARPIWLFIHVCRNGQPPRKKNQSTLEHDDKQLGRSVLQNSPPRVECTAYAGDRHPWAPFSHTSPCRCRRDFPGAPGWTEVSELRTRFPGLLTREQN